jgi:hypothetical protein
MTRVVVAKTNPKRTKKTLTPTRKKFRVPGGGIEIVRTLDSEDPKFGLMLEAAFRANVSKILSDRVPKTSKKAVKNSSRRASTKR